MKSQTIVTAEVVNNTNYGVCEAVNCYAKATKTIEVSAGPTGETVSLSVCDSCVGKFRNIVSSSEESSRQETGENDEGSFESRIGTQQSNEPRSL